MNNSFLKRSNLGRRLFIVIFLFLIPVFSKAQNANIPTLTPVFTPASSEADLTDQSDSSDEEDNETVTAKVINADTGSLINDKPTIPPFYFWRRAYQKKGKSSFNQYLTKEDGTFILSKRVGPNYEDFRRIGFGSVNNRENTIAQKNDSAITLTSPSGNWQVLQKNDTDLFHERRLFYKNSSSNDFTSIVMPFWEWGGQVGWNPKKDLFYYWTSGGPDTGRQTAFYQFDPDTKIFKSIGSGTCRLNFSPDGKWVIWVSGDGMAFSDRQLVAYDVDKNKNFIITDGHSDNLFDIWVDDPLLIKREEVAAQVLPHIEKGKKYYFAHDFDDAVSEYQKAIDIDPNNSEAYGLMGYSYFRQAKLDEARNALNTSASLDPHNLMAYYNLSLVVWAQKEHYQAVCYLGVYINGSDVKRRIVEKDPQFSEIIKSDEYKNIIIKKWGKSPRNFEE